MKKRIFALFLTITLIITSFSNSFAGTTFENLSETQKNSVTMLNYLVSVASKITNSKNSRIYLENAYNSLFYDTNLEALKDGDAYSYLVDLTDTINSFMMTETKRERLQYVYDQNKAQVLREILPNPLWFLNTNTSNLFSLIPAIVFMVKDAHTSYDTANNSLDMKYLQDGWNLDDEEKETIHEKNKHTLEYRKTIINKYGISGALSLTEPDINEFVKYTSNDNLAQRIQFLENKQDVYSAFGDYWIAKIEAYYNNKEYDKCIEAATAYENLNINIFNKQRDFSRVLPLVIASLDYSKNQLNRIGEIEKYCDFILKNTNDTEWDLKFFVAQTYLKLYSENRKDEYLKKVSDITLNNVNYLVNTQIQKNDEFLKEVQLKEVPKNAKTKREKANKKEIEQYNKLLKEERKKELAPLYWPLQTNLDLLFKVSDMLKISNSEKNKIDSILHNNGNDIFLVEAIDRKYRFNNKELSDYNIEFDGDKLIVPASCVTSDYQIKAEIKDNGTLTFFFWFFYKVDREENGTIDQIKVTFKSPTASKHKFVNDSIIKFVIVPSKGMEDSAIECGFNVKKEGFLPIKNLKFNKN